MKTKYVSQGLISPQAKFCNFCNCEKETKGKKANIKRVKIANVFCFELIFDERWKHSYIGFDDFCFFYSEKFLKLVHAQF